MQEHTSLSPEPGSVFCRLSPDPSDLSLFHLEAFAAVLSVNHDPETLIIVMQNKWKSWNCLQHSGITQLPIAGIRALGEPAQDCSLELPHASSSQHSFELHIYFQICGL